MRRRPELIQRRRTVGLTQEKLAERLGVDRTTVSRWEGAESEPQPWQRPYLAKLLGISAEELHDMLAAVVVLPDRANRTVVADDDQAGAAKPDSGTTDLGGDTSVESSLVPAGSATLDQLQAAIGDAYDLDGLRRVVGARPDFDIEDACKRGHGTAEVVGLLLEQASGQGWLPALLRSLRQDASDPTLRAVAERLLARTDRRAGVALVPSLEPGMVHRPDDLAGLTTLLTDAATTDTMEIVAVCGPGGFGKTTLATQACHDPRIRELFPEIVWVETGERCTPARVVQLISDLCVHLGGARPALTDPEQAGFHLARVLADRRALLVIDNVWSAADLAPFLLGGPGCVRLVTTRNVRVCPSHARLLRIGPMSPSEVRELLSRSVSTLGRDETARLAELCGGWPLLATVVGSSVGQDVAAGAPPSRAVSDAAQVFRTLGPQGFDVWDADQRSNAIGQAIASSLHSLEEHVVIGGGLALRDRYLSLAIFPAAIPIPLSVLSLWWRHAHGWTHSAVRQFCRVLADRSLIDAYLADRDAILLHDVFRAYLRHWVGDDWPGLHRSLVDAYRATVDGRWAELGRDHEYLWRHLSYHLREAGLDEELVGVLATPDYAVRKVAWFGHESMATDRTALEAVPALRDDHPARQAWRLAMVLTGSSYLLHDLTSSRDIAATLLVCLVRSIDAPQAMAQLRRIGIEQGDGLDIEWATTGVGLAPGDGDADAGHTGAVTAVATHGNLVASCGEDGTVRVWDLDTAQQVRTYRGHTGWVFTTAISPDGEVIASGGDDGMIRLWHRATGQSAGVLVAHTRRVRSLAFTSADRRLVSGAEDGRVLLWDTDRLRMVRAMQTPGCPVWSVAVGCADSLIAATGEDEFVRLYDLHSGRLVDEKAAHRDWVRSVAFAGAAPLLASGSGDRTVRLWGIADRRLRLIRTIDTGTARIRGVALSAEADLVVTAGEDARLRAFTSDGAAGERAMPPGVDWTRALALNPDGTVIAGCEDGGLRVWMGPTRDRLRVLADGSNTVWSTAFTDEGRTVAFGRGDGVVELRDAISADLLRTLPAGHGRVWSLAWGAGVLAAACGDGNVRAWWPNDGDRMLRLNEGERRTWAVAVNHAGTRLAASAGNGIVRVWELPSGRLLWEQAAHTGRIRSMAFDHRGDLLVSGGGEGTVRLWQGTSGAQLGEFVNPGGWVRAVTADASGGRVAVGSGLGDIYVRDLAQDRFVAQLFGHGGRMLMLGFMADPDRLASAGADGTVRLWSLAEQRQLAMVRVDGSHQCAAFDPRRRRVLAGSAAGVVSITLGDPTGKGQRPWSAEDARATPSTSRG